MPYITLKGEKKKKLSVGSSLILLQWASESLVLLQSNNIL